MRSYLSYEYLFGFFLVLEWQRKALKNQAQEIPEELENLGRTKTWSPHWKLLQPVNLPFQLLHPGFLYLEQQKQKRIEERERKKQEKDKKKEESVKRKGNKAAGKGNKAAGKGKEKQRQVQRCPSDQSSASDDDCVFRIGPSAPNDAQFSSGRPRRQPQLPSRFRSESDGENDGSICTVCGRNEPEGLGAEIVFWIDCSVCGEWAHNVCVFGSNTVTRQYVCKNC